MNLDHITSYLAEQLDSFVLVGYTMEGDRVRIRQFRTGQQEDALQQQLKDELREAEEGEMFEWVGGELDED